MSERPPVPPHLEEEELVAADDRLIGIAFRWSLAAIAVVAIVVASVVWWVNRPSGTEPPIIEKDPGAMLGLESPAAVLPRVAFTDITTDAGIGFVHESGAVGAKLLPETMGGGVAFLDYDGDGDQDLLLANGTSWPWDPAPPRAPTSKLFRNDGTGRFDDVTVAAGLDVSMYATGVACGDYDGDGDPDVYLTAVGSNRLLRNDDGRFTDVTAAAGVAGPDDEWSTSTGFFDADGDGDLDLWVCNYVEWSREIDIALNYTLNGTDRAYGPPTSYRGTHCSLYRNEGDGRFTDVSESAGLHVDNPATGTPVGKGLALVFLDHDADGALDVLVANDTTQNFLFRNRGDGTFEEIGTLAGVAYDSMGRATGAMGVDAAHFRNDRDLAVGIGNFANEMTSFYVRQAGSPQFADEAAIEGIGSPSRIALSFGLFFFDCDLDGRLDLFQTNGHLEEEISQVQPSQHYRQPSQLFWNAGPDARVTYAEMPPDAVGALATPIVGRGAAYADIDGDGDLDVVITQSGARPLLLRNDQKLGHHWLRVRLEGAAPNADAIGAWVECESGGVTQRRMVMPTKSYLSQCELPVTFGLGDQAKVDRLEVVWPDGTRQTVPVDGVDRVITVRRGDSAG